MKSCLVIFALILVSCSSLTKQDKAREKYFLTEVKPLLQQQCLACHNGTLPPPRLNLASAAAAFSRDAKGRDYIVPGSPDRSLMISAVQRLGTHPRLMPRADVSLTDDQIGMLREWIEDGAYWPGGEPGRLVPSSQIMHP